LYLQRQIFVVNNIYNAQPTRISRKLLLEDSLINGPVPARYNRGISKTRVSHPVTALDNRQILPNNLTDPEVDFPFWVCGDEIKRVVFDCHPSLSVFL
jgi:hypothetical protein